MTSPKLAVRSVVVSVYRTRLIIKAYVVRFVLVLSAGLISRLARGVSALYANNWGLLKLTYYDQMYNVLGGPASWLWTERGYQACREMTSESVVLDIGCSTGIYAAYFYAPRVKTVDAIDLCVHVIHIAKRRYRNIENLHFANVDVVRDSFPSHPYTVVVCNAVIEYLTLDEIPIVLDKIRVGLTPNGVLIGHTPIKSDTVSHQFGSKCNISSRDDVTKIMALYFNEVETWCSLETSRSIVYFRCRQPKC
jgi:SAM-dependent methyltransferase